MKDFGSATYSYIKKDKLGLRSLRCVFIGYLEGVKGFKLCYILHGRINTIISKDLVFNEHHFPLLRQEDYWRPEGGNIRAFEWKAEDTHMDDA